MNLQVASTILVEMSIKDYDFKTLCVILPYSPLKIAKALWHLYEKNYIEEHISGNYTLTNKGKAIQI